MGSIISYNLKMIFKNRLQFKGSDSPFWLSHILDDLKKYKPVPPI